MKKANYDQKCLSSYYGIIWMRRRCHFPSVETMSFHNILSSIWPRDSNWFGDYSQF